MAEDGKVFGGVTDADPALVSRKSCAPTSILAGRHLSDRLAMKRIFDERDQGLTEIRRTFCKAEARELLGKLWVGAPDEFDLVALAYRAGRLRIEDGGLDNAEGRIVAGPNGGTIRVKAGLRPGRRRFTIAHEIGHAVLHPREGMDREDTTKILRCGMILAKRPKRINLPPNF